MSTIGLDLGTSGVRAVSFDDDGRQLAASAVRTPLVRPRPGWVVFDAEAMLRSAEAVVATVSARAAETGDPVRAISYSSQGEAVVPVDRRGRALADAPVGMDGRGAHAAGVISERLGAARVQQITGQPLHPMFSLYKLMAGDQAWRPPQAKSYRTLGDFVFSRWGATPATDETVAARTGLLDVDSMSWSDALLSAVDADAPWVHDIGFSTLVRPGTELGTVCADASARMDLPRPTVLVAGLHDQAASFVSAGGAAGAVSVFSLGSSDCLTVETGLRTAGLAGTGFATYRWQPDRWLTLAGTAAGGWALEWFAALTGFDDPTELLSDLPVDPPDVVVLPYLAGSGTLDNDPAATGAVVGLTLARTRSELTRAFVEAAGYELAAIGEAFTGIGVEVGRLRAVGTGAADQVTLGIRAEAAGIALTAAPGHASARGAALLAAVGIGTLTIDDLPPTELLPSRKPSGLHAAWYANQRRRYRDLFAALCLLRSGPDSTDPT